MTTPETSLKQAERHVRDGTACVSQQEAILAELERDGHTGRTIEAGRMLLDALRKTLELQRDDLRRERERTVRNA